MIPVMALACTALPVPMAAMAAKSANSTAMAFAQRGTFPLFANARSQAYMAPPSISPLWSFTRYFTDTNTSAYFVAMPKMPAIHIQKTAPGPPAIMAVATPTIEPVPMVAASAVESAPKFEMSPSAPLSLTHDSLIACGSRRWIKPRRNVRKMCEPKSKAIIAGPQTMPSRVESSSSIWYSLRQTGMGPGSPKQHGRV